MFLKSLLAAVISALTLFYSTICTASDRAEQAWQLVDNGALLIDVRTTEEYGVKHLDDSINYPLNTIGKAFQGIDKDTEIVVYCRSGNRSGHAKAYLEQSGFTNVHNGGGLEEMIRAKYN